MLIHNPPNTKYIETLWLVLSVDPISGYEGVMAAPVGPSGAILPLQTSVEEHIPHLLEIAKLVTVKTGQAFVVQRFDRVRTKH